MIKKNSIIQRLFLAIFVVATALTSSTAQVDLRDGFIITQSNDTIYGKVDYRSNKKNYLSCLFKKDGQITKYLPGEIKGFGWENDKSFSSAPLDSVFAEIIFKGEISLYRYIDLYMQKEDNLFRLKTLKTDSVKGRKVETKINSQWRGIVAYLVSDCQLNTGSLLSSKNPQENALIKLLTKYHECRNAPYQTFAARKKWLSADFGVQTSLVLSDIGVKERPVTVNYLPDNFTSVDLAYGLRFSLKSPKITERVSLNIDLLYSEQSYHEFLFLPNASPEWHDSFIDLTVFNVPVSAQYILVENKYSLFTEFGFNLEYVLEEDTRMESQRSTFNIVRTIERSVFPIKNKYSGLFAAMGVSRNFNSIKASLGLRYFRNTEFDDSNEFRVNTDRFSINLVISRK